MVLLQTKLIPHHAMPQIPYIKTSYDCYYYQSLYAVVLKLLMNDNMEAMIEASRVFGNLSRTVEVRDFLTSKKGKSTHTSCNSRPVSVCG